LTCHGLVPLPLRLPFALSHCQHTHRKPSNAWLIPPPPPKAAYKIWPSQAPQGCPFKPSESIRGVGFTGRHAEYTGADTWYPSWAADGDLYSPWTDGNVNGLGSTSAGKDATTGNAKIFGDDPLKLKVVDQDVYKSDPSPYAGATLAAAWFTTASGIMELIVCILPAGSPGRWYHLQLAVARALRRLPLVYGFRKTWTRPLALPQAALR